MYIYISEAAGEHRSHRPTKTLQCSCVNVSPSVYLYIVLPLGAYKSQLGGTYGLLLLVYTVNDPCDFIYIYISINVPNVHVITSTTTELHAEHPFLSPATWVERGVDQSHGSVCWSIHQMEWQTLDEMPLDLRPVDITKIQGPDDHRRNWSNT